MSIMSSNHSGEILFENTIPLNNDLFENSELFQNSTFAPFLNNVEDFVLTENEIGKIKDRFFFIFFSFLESISNSIQSNSQNEETIHSCAELNEVTYSFYNPFNSFFFFLKNFLNEIILPCYERIESVYSTSDLSSTISTPIQLPLTAISV